MTAPNRVLCLDTSTPTARVALFDGAGQVLAGAEATAERHSQHVLKLVDDVLRRAGARPEMLAGIACGAGPGSLTGLRVGLAVAKGLALATGVPLLLVSSLQALATDIARGAAAGTRFVVPCIDAGKGEVYAFACALGDGAVAAGASPGASRPRRSHRASPSSAGRRDRGRQRRRSPRGGARAARDADLRRGSFGALDRRARAAAPRARRGRRPREVRPGLRPAARHHQAEERLSHGSSSTASVRDFLHMRVERSTPMASTPSALATASTVP